MILHNIQTLRAVAALFVVGVHLNPLLPLAAPNGGVDLFFVISGFIMVIVTADGATPGSFFVRRVVRVALLYWAVTLFAAALIVLLPSAFSSSTITCVDLLRSLLFIPFAKAGNPELQPILYVGWTLNYEIFFYGIFAVALSFGRKAVTIVSVVLLLLVTIGQVLPLSPVASFYTSPILLEFAFGMWGGALYLRRSCVPTVAAVALLLFALPFGLFGERLAPGLNRAFSLGAPSAVIVYVVAQLERTGAKMRALSLLGNASYLLGNASYSIYLTHAFVTGAAIGVAGTVGRLPAFAGGLALVLVLGLLSYHWLERPMQRNVQDHVVNIERRRSNTT